MNEFLCLKRKEALHDHCGVFGIFAPKEDVAKITYFALHSLQHRGQEGAGIAVSDGRKLRSIRRLGLVTSVFNEDNLSKLKGFIAIGTQPLLDHRSQYPKKHSAGDSLGE